jgi:hypothetical protein
MSTATTWFGNFSNSFSVPVVGKKIAVRRAIKWRDVQQGSLSVVNDRVFIEQGARHKPTSQRLVAGVFVAPAIYVVMAFRTCRDKFSEV